MKNGYDVQTRSKTKKAKSMSQREAPVQAVETDPEAIFAPFESISSDISSLAGSPYTSVSPSPLSEELALEDTFSYLFPSEGLGLDFNLSFEIRSLPQSPLPLDDTHGSFMIDEAATFAKPSVPVKDEYGSFIIDEGIKPTIPTVAVTDEFASFLREVAAQKAAAADHGILGYDGLFSLDIFSPSPSAYYCPPEPYLETFDSKADEKPATKELDPNTFFADNGPYIQSAPLVVATNNGSKKNEDETQGSEKKEQPQPPETSKPITPAFEATKRRPCVPILAERKSKLAAIEKMYRQKMSTTKIQ